MPDDKPYYLHKRNPSGIYYYRFKHSMKARSTRCHDREDTEAFVESLTAEETDDWLFYVERTNSMRNQILFTFRIVLDEAVRKSVVQRNVARDVQQWAADYRPRDVFTDEDLACLFPEEPESFDYVWGRFEVGVMAYLSLVSGARHSELRALQWSDVMLGQSGGGVIVISRRP